MPSLTSCVNHARRPAVGTCPSCGRSFCELCMTYRGTKYICKACAGPSLGAQTMVMQSGPEGRGAAEPNEPAASARGRKSKYGRSRYDLRLRLRHYMKRLALFLVLLLAGVAAYLPYIVKYAMDDALSGSGYLTRDMAPTLVTLAGRVHLLYGRADDAINIYETGISELPQGKQAEAYFYLGKAYVKELNYADAAETFETFMRRWPDHPLFLKASEELRKINLIENNRKMRHVDTPNVRDGTYSGAPRPD